METTPARQEWLKVLANAPSGRLAALWDSVDKPVPAKILRQPDTGLAMLRGRADGAGRPFNLGEATVTRCVVTSTDSHDGSEIMGIGYVLGRDKRHAQIAARFDAHFQDNGTDAESREAILAPLRDVRCRKEAQEAGKTAATRVDFFTMVRGE